MKIYLLKLCSIIMVMALVISGCGKSDTKTINNNSNEQTASKKSDEAITLNLWHIWAADSESNKKPVEKVIADWNAQNPKVEIVADATENEAYKTKLRTSMAANDLPDIFFTWGSGSSQPYIEAGKVLKLDDYLNDGIKDRMLEGTTVNFTYDGSIYGLPTNLAVAAFYCNTELFEKYGIKIPENYDELIGAVKAFRTEGVTPMTVGEKDRWPGMHYYNIMALRTAGNEECNAALKKEISFDQPEFVEAASKLQELVDLGAFNEGAIGLTRDEAEIPFLNGEIPMYYGGSWVAGTIEAGSNVDGKIVAKKFPSIPGAKGNVNEFLGGAINTFMVSASTKYKDESVSALKFLCENFSKESFKAGAGLPTWKMEEEIQSDGLIGQIVDLTKDASGFVIWWDTYLAGEDAETHKNLVQELFANTISAEDFAKTMQTKINEK